MTRKPPCKRHRPGIGWMGYVESSIEARRRLRAGWTQDLCKHCGRVYVWHQPVKYGRWAGIEIDDKPARAYSPEELQRMRRMTR